MIPQSPLSSYPHDSDAIPLHQQGTWQEELQNLIRTPEELLKALHLEKSDANSKLAARLEAANEFPLRVTRFFTHLMEAGNPNDPLLLQALPSPRELEHHDGFTHDPLGEADSNPTPGLIHKYHGRVLLTNSGQCAINCRYCFRRHFPYAENRLTQENWESILAYLSNDTNIQEVIFSGGDPLTLNNRLLQKQIHDLEQIPHIRRLRFHTRLPVVLPQRIDADFLDILNQTKLQTVMVIHCNHPQEISPELISSLRLLKQQNITLLNQSVLLKGINDDEEILTELSEVLFDAGVQPYYLHLLDPVEGASHFNIPKEDAQNLLAKLTKRLPGYLLPRLAQEKAGALAKIQIPPSSTSMLSS